MQSAMRTLFHINCRFLIAFAFSKLFEFLSQPGGGLLFFHIKEDEAHHDQEQRNHSKNEQDVNQLSHQVCRHHKVRKVIFGNVFHEARQHV